MGAGVFPAWEGGISGGVGLAAAVGVLGSFADPEAAFFVPVDIHHFIDEGLGGDEGEIEFGVDLDFGGGFRGRGGAPFGITEGVAEFGREAELVHVFAVAGPSDAAQENGAVVGSVEVEVEVARDGNEGAVGSRLAGARRYGESEGAFVGPELGLDVVDIDGLFCGDGFGGAGLRLAVATAAGVDGFWGVGGGEDVGLGEEIHVVVNLVVHLPVGGVAGDGMLAVDEVEMHRGLEELRGALAPGAADDGLIPIGVLGDGGGVDDDEAAAAGEVGAEIGAVGFGDVAGFLSVEDEDVGGGELFGGGKGVAARGDGAARIEERDPIGEEARVVVGAGAVGFRTGADVDAEGLGGGERGGEDDGEEGDEGEEAFHGVERKREGEMERGCETDVRCYERVRQGVRWSRRLAQGSWVETSKGSGTLARGSGSLAGDSIARKTSGSAWGL